MKSRLANATKENARYVQHDARFIGVSEQPELRSGMWLVTRRRQGYGVASK